MNLTILKFPTFPGVSSCPCSLFEERGVDRSRSFVIQTCLFQHLMQQRVKDVEVHCSYLKTKKKRKFRSYHTTQTCVTFLLEPLRYNNFLNKLATARVGAIRMVQNIHGDPFLVS